MPLVLEAPQLRFQSNPFKHLCWHANWFTRVPGSLTAPTLEIRHHKLKMLLSGHQDAQTVTFESSTALMDNAWRDFEKRGVKVTAMREPGWRWWRPSVDPMQARFIVGFMLHSYRLQAVQIGCCFLAIAGLTMPKTYS